MDSLEQDDMLISEALESIENVEELTFTPVYLPYSHWRIKEWFLSQGIELRPYYTWYKAMRYRDCQCYVLVNMYTNEIIGYERGYTLYYLRCFLAKNGVPLHSDKPKKNYRKPKRNEGCERFLQIVSNLKNPDEN